MTTTQINDFRAEHLCVNVSHDGGEALSYHRGQAQGTTIRVQGLL